MQLITPEDLRAKLFNQVGATFATVVTRSEPRMRKRDNPYFGIVEKLQRLNGVINFVYSRSVNRQRQREGHPEEFEAQPRRWGERVFDNGRLTPLVRHIKDGEEKWYLELKLEQVIEKKYIDHTGQEVQEETLQPWLPEPRQAATQETEKEIVLLDISLDNIRAIVMGGEEYVVNRKA